MFYIKITINFNLSKYGVLCLSLIHIFKFKGKIKILSPKECITEMQQIAQDFI